MNIAQWAIGILATISLAFNGYNQNTNQAQSADIYDLNREVGGLSKDIEYIKEGIDDLKEAQGLIKKSYASSTQATLP